MRQKLLAATILQPDRRWYFRELARYLEVTPSSIQRELAGLSGAGILRREQDGNRVIYQADRDCPIFPELERILLKTVGVAGVLEEALGPLRARIEVAVVYGSLAASAEHSRSDVDLLVVGEAGLAEVAGAVRGLARILSREVNATVYTTEEFLRRAGRGSHFLSTMLGQEKIFLYGTEDELAGLVARSQGEAAPDESAGDV